MKRLTAITIALFAAASVNVHAAGSAQQAYKDLQKQEDSEYSVSAQDARAASKDAARAARAAAKPVASTSPWFQTAAINDEGTIQREYIIPHSVMQLGNVGRIYSVKVRDTFDPPAGGRIQAVLSEAIINCDNMTWGEVASVAFKSDGEPTSFSVAEMNHGRVWLPKDMGPPNVAPYKTLVYICNSF